MGFLSCAASARDRDGGRGLLPRPACPPRRLGGGVIIGRRAIAVLLDTWTAYMLPCTGYSCTMANRRSGSVARERLSRDSIVAGALALAEADGLDPGAHRRLAPDHEVTPMAVFLH